MKFSMRSTPFKAALFVAAFATPAAQSSILDNGFEDCKVATSNELDEMRGGFEINNGWLKMSFGLERLAFINGELVARTTLNLPSMGGGPTIVQNGPNNNFTPPEGLNQAMIIQNTLDNTHIGSMTIIDVTMNSMALVRGMAVSSSLNLMLQGSH